ncbi:hypothetical protein ACQW5G_05060 [Fructilactobacillus sp. Tb1]|uniref:hypothetical protein n=1 Tax=Fructilactobacillus sp. Tb1 TaxID=3422304 RepID=UPI003D27C7A3
MEKLKKYRKLIIAGILGLITLGLLILGGFNIYALNQNNQKLADAQTKYDMLKKSLDEMKTSDVTYQENLTYQNMKTIAETNNDSLTDSMKIVFGNYPNQTDAQAAITNLTKNYMDTADATELINSAKQFTRLNNVKIYNYSNDAAKKGHYYYSNVTVTYYGKRGNHLSTNHYLFKVDLNHQDLNSNKIRFHLIQSFRGDHHAK